MIVLLAMLAACGGGVSTAPGGGGSNTSAANTAPIKEGGILRIGYTDRQDQRVSGKLLRSDY